MLGDKFYVDLVRRQVIEDAIIGLPVDPPEPGAADVRDARGELEAEKVEDAEDGVGIPRRVGHDLGGLEFRLLLKDDGKQMEAVAQSSGHCNCVQAGELIGSQVVPGDTPFTAEVAWIRPRVDRAHGHDEPKPVGGGDLSSSPATGERYGVLSGDERRVGRRQGLGTDEVLLDPA